jgi:hypothetical protein
MVSKYALILLIFSSLENSPWFRFKVKSSSSIVISYGVDDWPWAATEVTSLELSFLTIKWESWLEIPSISFISFSLIDSKILSSLL